MAPGSSRGSRLRRARRGRAALVGIMLATLIFVPAGGAHSSTAGAALWTNRHLGPAFGDDSAHPEVLSPDGTKLFVSGQSTGLGTGEDYDTFAYNTATGAKLWEARYDGPGHAEDIGRSLAASPDGTKVFVTGSSFGSGSNGDFATVAYNAATGAKL